MNKENNKLGMGLGALLGGKNIQQNNTNKIDISKIHRNKNQPRKNFESKELKELSDSIKNQGLIQPVVVREVDENSYEICTSVLNSITWPKSFPSPLEYNPGVKLGVNFKGPSLYI